ncbi:MAG: sugar-binding protein [Planctomycetes bacterium]|nr:sugar-binding protein [Planctomycetota bacterium]
MFKISRHEFLPLFAALAGLLPLAACTPGGGSSSGGGGASGNFRLAFVTNNPSDFWKIAEAGVNKAKAEHGVHCEMKHPANGTAAEQKAIVEDLIARRFDGIAISAIAPESQTELINEACKVMKVITQDSDAPQSNRICYVGTNNYKAGQQAGEALKQAIPQGGKVWLFVGRADAQNAIDRKRGLVDAVKGSSIQIVDTRTDDTDRQRAKSNVEDVIAKNSNAAALVGLWAYNGPAILEAVKTANKTGQIKIICFDEDEPTLQGVKDGHIFATVVQQPYQFGYESVRILKALVKGDSSVVPENKIVDVPAQVIKKENVEAFWANLKRLKSGG